MFNFIGGLVSTLFGGSGATTKATDFAQTAAKGIGNWIDEQKFTDQESAEMRLKAGDMMLDMVKATHDENSVRSVTRRVLAWAIMGTFLLLILMSVILYRIDVEYAKFVFDVATKSDLGWLAAGVGGFYFLAHVVRANK